jgi:hypothetical protein
MTLSVQRYCRSAAGARGNPKGERRARPPQGRLAGAADSSLRSSSVPSTGTVGMRRRTFLTDNRRHQDIRERLYGLDSPYGTFDPQH